MLYLTCVYATRLGTWHLPRCNVFGRGVYIAFGGHGLRLTFVLRFQLRHLMDTILQHASLSSAGLLVALRASWPYHGHINH